MKKRPCLARCVGVFAIWSVLGPLAGFRPQPFAKRRYNRFTAPSCLVRMVTNNTKQHLVDPGYVTQFDVILSLLERVPEIKVFLTV